MAKRRDGSGELLLDFTGGLTAMEEACRRADVFFSEHGGDAALFQLRLLLREALANAVLHGNAGDPEKAVRLRILREPGGFRLEVGDSGPGFDWKDACFDLPDPSCERGRGLFVMRSYADEVSFNERGTEVTLFKRIPVEDEDMGGTGDREAGRNIVDLGTAVSASRVEELRGMLRGAMDASPEELVLECGRLEVMDSLGIGLLVATHNTLSRAGGRLVLVNTPPDIVGLLRTMRLDRHFTVLPGGLEP